MTEFTVVPPVTIILTLTGLAVWVEGMYFLGLMPYNPANKGTGSGHDPDGAAIDPNIKPWSHPRRAAGTLMLIAGISDMIQMYHIMGGADLETAKTVILCGMLAYPCGWFTYLGFAQVFNLDMRAVGYAAIPVGLVPLAWLPFFSDSWMFQADLFIWGLAFLAVAFHHAFTLISDKALGAYITFVAVFAFFLQPALYGYGHGLATMFGLPGH